MNVWKNVYSKICNETLLLVKSPSFLISLATPFLNSSTDSHFHCPKLCGLVFKALKNSVPCSSSLLLSTNSIPFITSPVTTLPFSYTILLPSWAGLKSHCSFLTPKFKFLLKSVFYQADLTERRSRKVFLSVQLVRLQTLGADQMNRKRPIVQSLWRKE